MKQLFASEGMRLLRTSWILLVTSLAAGAVIISATYWFMEREKGDSLASNRRLKEAKARVEGVRRESASLQESAETFRTLLDRGLMQTERRLDLVELMNALRAHNRLFALDYEIAPQRVLALPGSRSFVSIDVLASRVRIKVRALHEGDVLGFIDALAQSRQGFYPVDHCVLKRVDAGADTLQPRVEAECTMEWITLKEKKDARAS